MNDKTKKTFRGWIALSYSERQDFQKAVNEYETASDRRKTEISESIRSSVTKMDTGPVSGGCPCCGK
jgi:uncharacterized protein Yka (UPF0111/DUF47 family)